MVELVIDGFERLDRIIFTVEGLDNVMATVHFFDMAVDLAERFLLGPEIALRAPDHDADEGQRGRNYEDGSQGHQPIDGQHHGEDADDGRDGGDQLGQALVERLADQVDVVGDPGKDLAVGPGVVIIQRDTVHLGRDVFSEIIGDVHRDTGHDVSLDVGENGRDDV